MNEPRGDTGPAGQEQDEEARRSAQSAAISLGTQLLAGMVVFAGLGIWIDHRFSTGPVGTLAGIFLGLFYGAYEVWKLVARINESEQQGREQDPPGSR